MHGRVIYDFFFLHSTYGLKTITGKPFLDTGKIIMGWGMKHENIPEHVIFGENILLLNKQYYEKILSVKDKNMHAVDYLPNVKVSDNFVDIIFGICKKVHSSKDAINNSSTTFFRYMVIYKRYEILFCIIKKRRHNKTIEQ